MDNSKVYRLSKKDTEESRAILKAELKSLAQQANQRLAYLRRYRKQKGDTGTHVYALNAAERELSKMGLEKYDANKATTSSALAKQIYSANKFLRMKTSTLKGIKETEKDARRAMRAMGVRVPVRYSETFFRFISEDLVQEIKSLDSGRIFAQVMDAIKEGRTLEDLRKAYEEYERNDKITIDVAWEKWSGRNPFD